MTERQEEQRSGTENTREYRRPSPSSRQMVQSFTDAVSRRPVKDKKDGEVVSDDFKPGEEDYWKKD